MGDESKAEQFVCKICNVVVNGKIQWEQHNVSKNHMRRAINESQFELDEKNLFVDSTTEAYIALSQNKAPLVGCEYIIFDRDSLETKCTACRVLLKDGPAVLTHVKSPKHVHVFFRHHYPIVFEELQKRCKNRADLQSSVSKYSDLLLKKYGGKRDPRVHQSHYYDSLSEDRKEEVKAVMIKRQMEMEEQRAFQLKDSSSWGPQPSRPDRSSDRGGRHRRSRSRDRDRRSRSRDRDRDRDRRRRSRSPRSHRSPNRSRDRDSRDSRDRSRGLSRSFDSRSDHYPSPHKAPPRGGYGSREYYPDEGRRDHGGDRGISPGRPLDPNSLDYLPTEPDVFEKLCSSRITNFEPGERAYIQDLVDAIQTSVIGLEYMAEYSDPKGHYEPGYLCNLCLLRLNPAQAVQHCVSEMHSMAFLKKHHQKQHMALCIGTLGEEVRRQMKARYLAEIEAGERGRQITRKILLNPDFRQAFIHHKRVTGIVQDYGHHGSGRQPSSSMPYGGYEDPRGHGQLPYSDGAMKAKELADLERNVPAYCQRDLENGWYSIRSKSIDYFRQMALAQDPSAKYFSIRDPYGKQNFYGDWNPQLMRRLQDKFGFKLDHLTWLQDLLTKWRIPTYAPVQPSDLGPLKPEVEEAVLNELLGKILKPVSTLKYMQTFEYENYDDDRMEPGNDRKRANEPPPIRLPTEFTKRKSDDRSRSHHHESGSRDHGSRRSDHKDDLFPEKKTPKLNPDPPPILKIGIKSQQKQLLQHNADVAAALGGPADSDEEKEMEEERRAQEEANRENDAKNRKKSRWQNDGQKSESKTENSETQETEVEKKLRTVIDSVLKIANQSSQTKNPIMQLLAEFENARDILFRMATRQPAQLQQLVTVARNPGLTVPPEVLSQLRRRLKEVEVEVIQQREEEEAKRKKELEEKLAAEMLLRQKQEAEEAKKAKGLQLLTPKMPGMANPPAPTPSFQAYDFPTPAGASTSKPPSNTPSSEKQQTPTVTQKSGPPPQQQPPASKSEPTFPQQKPPPLPTPKLPPAPQTSQVMAAVQRAIAPGAPQPPFGGGPASHQPQRPSSILGSSMMPPPGALGGGGGGPPPEMGMFGGRGPPPPHFMRPGMRMGPPHFGFPPRHPRFPPDFYMQQRVMRQNEMMARGYYRPPPPEGPHPPLLGDPRSYVRSLFDRSMMAKGSESSTKLTPYEGLKPTPMILGRPDVVKSVLQSEKPQSLLDLPIEYPKGGLYDRLRG